MGKLIIMSALPATTKAGVSTETFGDFKKFESGNIYIMQFIGDADLKPKFICTARSAKFATFERLNSKEVIRRKISVDGNGVEYVVDGNYSMAPSIRANKVVG